MHPFKALQAHQHQTVLDNLVKQIIKQRQGDDDGDNKRDLLTLLLRAQDPESKYRLTDVEVHDEIIAFLFGGFETTTSQLCWILYHLGKCRVCFKSPKHHTPLSNISPPFLLCLLFGF